MATNKFPRGAAKKIENGYMINAAPPDGSPCNLFVDFNGQVHEVPGRKIVLSDYSLAVDLIHNSGDKETAKKVQETKDYLLGKGDL